jgi:hypothetical protein
MAFALTLLGSFQALDNGQPKTFATSAARGLLAYLAVEQDRPHSRELLAAMLWPDVPQRAAYVNLRQTLARLRRALPGLVDGALSITPQSVRMWFGLRSCSPSALCTFIRTPMLVPIAMPGWRRRSACFGANFWRDFHSSEASRSRSG